ncbi:MAG: hypothetical protein C9356_06720 [Oleiphilus sp.]|nr:MAG: hypothetical protein C9356_06720 [Oleiphilus sp.]
MNRPYDVIIVGAGMVGATIACGLARSDLKIAIIDAVPAKPYEPDAVPGIRVSAISLASENVLTNVGAWQFLKETRLCPYRHLAVNELPAEHGLAAKLPDISSWARTQFSAQEIGQSHLGYIIENDLIQWSLQQVLLTHSNVSLLCPKNIVAMDLQSDTKTITLETGEVLESALVIGADGAQSQVRQAANIGQYREQYTQSALVATVSYQGAQQDITWQSFTEHGPLAFLPLAESGGQQYASLVWYDKTDAIRELMAMELPALRRLIQQKYPPELPRLNRIEARGSFPLFKSHAHHYAKAGVVLAGDAAHTINPLAGQGVNLGFMDAAVLVDILLKAQLNGERIADLTVLRRFEKKRRLSNQSMMGLMDVFYHGFGNKHLPVRVARNLGLGFAQRLGFAKHKVMAYATGLSGDLPRLAKPV